MNAVFKESNNSGKLKNAQVLNNIKLIMSEINMLNSQVVSSRLSPVYRTIQEFEIQEFFDCFGLRETPFLRLSKSRHLHTLPILIIVHCSAFLIEDDEPKLIDNKLYISHEYFQSWIESKDNEIFENGLLQLTLSYLNIRSDYSN